MILVKRLSTGDEMPFPRWIYQAVSRRASECKFHLRVVLPSSTSRLGKCLLRYIAEENGFGNFHIYVCAVFLVYWSPQLKQMDFEQLLLFLQKVSNIFGSPSFGCT